ncbi:MAG TPA: NifB/NifX family molybdenum-iron cluster-binding protein, partial [Anaeromyxobacter sp.]
REFLVYDVDRRGARLVGRRAVEASCAGGEGDDDALAATLRALAGCRAVLVAKVGRCPAARLAAAGIEVVTAHAYQPIEAAALAWLEALAARVARETAELARPALAVATAPGEAA